MGKKNNLSCDHSAGIGVVEPQKAHFNEPLELRSGVVMTNYDLMYETYGQLNKERSNAILVCHALSGSHHLAGYYADEPNNIGWWDNMIGPGRPLDTNRFFVVGVNNLGGCHGSTGPSSICEETGQPWGSKFPVLAVIDWVRAQAKLADLLGIKVWSAIVGGSLGGMQTLRWTITYPDRVKNALVIASAPSLTAENIAYNEVARQSIMQDPHFFGGDYYGKGVFPQKGLSVARMLGHITYLGEAQFSSKFGRKRRALEDRFDFDINFEIESYLHYQGDKFSGQFDANTYLLMTRALDYFDPARLTKGDLSKVLSRAKARFLVVSFSSDLRFAPSRSHEIVQALLKNKQPVSYAEVDSPFGHDSFLMKNGYYHNVVRGFMGAIRL